MWTPGYWAYGDDGYYWVPGAWVPAPYEGALWTPPYWGWSGGLYVFHPGYWGPHVGYYGGVNYGFGFMGVGFVGGIWRGHDFVYNTAVVHVNNVYVHNTYIDRTVVERNTIVNDRHVAFSGGPGGIHHEPTAKSGTPCTSNTRARRKCSSSTCRCRSVLTKFLRQKQWRTSANSSSRTAHGLQQSWRSRATQATTAEFVQQQPRQRERRAQNRPQFQNQPHRGSRRTNIRLARQPQYQQQERQQCATAARKLISSRGMVNSRTAYSAEQSRPAPQQREQSRPAAQPRRSHGRNLSTKRRLRTDKLKVPLLK